MKFIFSFLILFILNFFFSFNLYGDEIREGVLRTPDERFENLKDYPFKPNYMIFIKLKLTKTLYLDSSIFWKTVLNPRRPLFPQMLALENIAGPR